MKLKEIELVGGCLFERILIKYIEKNNRFKKGEIYEKT